MSETCEIFPIASLGQFANRALHTHSHGQVLAVFRRSFYVVFGTEIVCFGPLSLGPGPLNALCPLPDEPSWLDGGLAAGLPVERHGSHIQIEDRFAFDLATAAIWRAPTNANFSPLTLRDGLPRLAASVRRRAPGGLGAYIGDLSLTTPHVPMSATPVEPSLRHAAHPIAVVRHWLASSLSSASDPPPAIAALIGLGPGLTPSGDDFLGGVLAALHYLGHAEVADRLAHLVLPIAAENTSLISAAYLRAAAAGEAAKVLYDTLDAVLAGDNASLERQLDAIGAVGHTSGWDALAGAVVVCSARAK